MDSSDPTTIADVSADGDLLVSVPPEPWPTIRRVQIFGFGLVALLTVGFLLLNALVHHSGVTTVQRVLVALAGLFFLGAVFKAILIWFSLKPPIAIYKSGIAFQGVKMPWEAIEGCRWAQDLPDNLVVLHHRLQDYVRIPRNQRSAVEAAFAMSGSGKPD